MRRASTYFGIASFLAAMLCVASSAWAKDTISVTAAVSGNTVVVQATGVAPDCASDNSCTVDVELSSSTDGTSCPLDEDLSPQGSTDITSSDGSFAFTFNIHQPAGDTYVVCGYIASYGSADTSARPTQVTIPATACRFGTQHALDISAPSHVAFGRSASIDVGYNPSSQQTVDTGTLTARALSSSRPFYSHPLTVSDANNFNAQTDEYFSVSLPPRSGPDRISLSYLEDQSGSYPPECIDQRSVTVQPVAGKTPTVKLSTYDGTVSFSARGGCNVTRIVSGEIDVRGSGANSKLHTKDVCRPGSWRVSGRTPGVSTDRAVDATGSVITFNSVAPINRQYPMVVRVGGKVAKYVLMSTVYQHTPATRVFEGTDAYINYCIDGSHTLHSYHLQLFCWRPGSTTQYIILTS